MSNGFVQTRLLPPSAACSTISGGQKSGAPMADALSRPTRPRIWRLQFSLAGIFVLMTLSAVGVWYWYQRPYVVENKEYAQLAPAAAVDPFAAPGTPPPASSRASPSDLIRRE